MFFDPVTATQQRSLLVQGDRLLTEGRVALLQQSGPLDPLTFLPFGVQPLFLRGEAQTNTLARISQSLFSKIGDYRSSVGLELRIQMPVSTCRSDSSTPSTRTRAARSSSRRRGSSGSASVVLSSRLGLNYGSADSSGRPQRL
jgi:hypothetical protein